MTNNIIKAEALLSDYAAAHWVIVDARAGADARDLYQAEHLKGAIFVDLETGMSQKSDNAANGGRHPLPSAAQFAALVGQIGITPETTVVVYDDKNGANAAARFWWMLRALGHPSVSVLDGGMQAAVAAGFPLQSGTEKKAAQAPFPNTTWQWPTADILEVETVASTDDHVVIDVRDAVRYLGRTEPIDLIAGHIPGAINVPFSENLDASGAFLSAEALAEKYQTLLSNVPSENVIVHCGSGVTACHTLLAIAQAGMPMPKLYVGSWSEWSRTDRPIATESRF